jgi:hypothetical protein
VDATVRDLPTPLRQRAKQVPITFESTPGDDLLRDGVEADTLGLFVGSAFPDELANPDPLPRTSCFSSRTSGITPATTPPPSARRCGGPCCMNWATTWVWTRIN